MSNREQKSTEETEAITVHLPISLKSRVRVAAALKGKAMSPYVVEVLDKQVPKSSPSKTTK